MPTPIEILLPLIQAVEAADEVADASKAAADQAALDAAAAQATADQKQAVASTDHDARTAAIQALVDAAENLKAE